MNAEATIVSGRDIYPLAAVAVPVVGRFNLPPTLMAVVAVCVRSELCTLVAVVHRGRAFTVPPVVLTVEEEAGVLFDVELGSAFEEAAASAPFDGGAASTNADAGRPLRVCASAAFSA